MNRCVRIRDASAFGSLTFGLLALLCALVSNASAQDLPRLSFEQAAGKLASRGFILMMRHAQTVPGVGDPENFKLGDCDTQRNLSAEGREQAKRIGGAFARAGVRFDIVRSSQWCRTRETARLAFGADEEWPALNSSFRNRDEQAGRSRQIIDFARAMNRAHNAMLVTHQITITALAGGWVESAEIVAFRYEGEQLRPQFRIIAP